MFQNIRCISILESKTKKMTMCYLHWPIKVGISYIQTCMYVTCIHIIDACIYLCVDTHTHTHAETERLHVLTLVLTPNIGIGQPHMARFDCLAVGRAKSCSNLVVRRHVFVERSVGYYVKNVGLFLLHSSFGIWEVINIKVFGEVHQTQFR